MYVCMYLLCLCMYVYIYIFGLPLFFVFVFISLYFLFNLWLTLSLLSGSNTLYYILPNCSNIVDYFILLYHCYLLSIDIFFFFLLFCFFHFWSSIIFTFTFQIVDDLVSHLLLYLAFVILGLLLFPAWYLELKV